MEQETRQLPLSLIREPRFLLRPVDRSTVTFMEMRDSIEKIGFINSICVVKRGDFYEVLDGNHRYSCAIDLALATIPCIIKEGLTENDIMALQIQAQAIRPETKPVEFAQQLKKIMARAPDMTFTELAKLVNKSSHWVKQHLGLLNLEKPIQMMVDRGEVPLQSAFLLARIPPTLRGNYLDDARCLPAREFKPIAAGVIKAYAEAVKQGRMNDFYSAEIKAQPHLRPLKEILYEQNQHVAGPAMVAAEKCKEAGVWTEYHLGQPLIGTYRNSFEKEFPLGLVC